MPVMNCVVQCFTNDNKTIQLCACANNQNYACSRTGVFVAEGDEGRAASSLTDEARVASVTYSKILYNLLQKSEDSVLPNYTTSFQLLS